jgi:hypothetical protein
MHGAETGHHSGGPRVFSGIFCFLCDGLYILVCPFTFFLLAIISYYQWYLQIFLIKVIWFRFKIQTSIFVTQILRSGWQIHGGVRDDFKVTAMNPRFCSFFVSCNLLSIISNVPLKVFLKQLMIYRRAENGCQSIVNSQITFVKKS